MNRLKRLISFVLVLCMAMTLGSYLGFAEESVSVPAELTDKISVLSALDILADAPVEMTKTVSRTEFANALVMTVLEEAGSYDAVGDLGGSDTGMIWMYQAGMLHGNGAGEFRPADGILVSEATKLALAILGYDNLAEEEGGYPAGYHKIANRIGVLDGVQGAFGAEMTYQDFVIMLYNLIHIEIMEPIGYHTDGLVRYKMGGVHTLLEVYRDIHKGKGIVDANEVSGLYDAADATPAGMLNVGDDMLEATAVYDKYIDMLGHQVEYWYKNHSDIRKELLVMVPVDEENLVIQAVDILSYNDGVYRYEDENDNAAEVSISNETTLLYNGEYIVNNTIFKPEMGSVELIDNNSDGNYDVLKIRDKKLTVVQGTYEANGTFTAYDMFDLTYNVSVNTVESGRYRVYDVNGKPKALSDIVAGHVLEVEKSGAAKPYQRITLVSDNKAAKIQSKMANGYGTEDGNYETTPRFDLLLEKKDIEIQFGATYNIFFASDGRIAYVYEGEIEDTLLTYRLGYLSRTTELESTFSKTWMLRILDESGAWDDFELAERLIFDGEEGKKRKDIKTTDLSSHEGSLVRYLLNIRGEIAEIYFPEAIPASPSTTAMDEKFQIVYENTSARYRYYPTGYVFGSSSSESNIVQVPDTTRVFIKPQTMTAENSSDGYFKEEFVGVSTAAEGLTDGTNYDVVAYSISGTPGIADVALVGINNAKGLLKEDARAVVINEVAKTIGENGEDCYMVTALYNGQSKNYDIYDERTGTANTLPFGPGDVVILYSNAEGKYVIYDNTTSNGHSVGCGWKMLCDYTPKAGIDPYLDRDRFNGRQPVVKITDGGNRVKYGTVYDVQASNLFINTTQNLKDWQAVEALNTGKGYVYVWDEKKQTFRAGTNYDAICAKYDPVNATKAYVVDNNKYIIVALYPAESVNNAGN